MDAKQQEGIRKLMLSEIEKTEHLISECREMTQPIAPDDAIGRITRMDAINNKSVNEATLRQAEQKLKLLQENVKRIGETDFGLCLKCKCQIPLGRIVLMPHSRYCVKCAT